MATAIPIVLITGANTGIGYEAVKAFLASPTTYHVILGSRSAENGNAAISQLKSEFPDSPTTLELLLVDLTSDESIASAFETVSSKHDHIDALVNNAGAQFDHWLGNTSGTIRETLNWAFDVNVSGTHVFTHTFAPLLLSPARSPTITPRLLFLTSGLSSLTTAHSAFFPPTFPVKSPAGWPKDPYTLPIGYRCSKAALNMLMLGWRYTLEPDGVKTFCIAPGFLATNLGGNRAKLQAMGAGDPALGGKFIKDVVDGARDGDSGLVVRSGEVQPW